MCKPRPSMFPHLVSVKPSTRHFPGRPIFPGSIARTRKLGTVQVKSHTRRIGF
jgi:hypothetical protein